SVTIGQIWAVPDQGQGLCWSSWAFAVVGAVEAQYNIFYKNSTYDLDLSEEDLVTNCSDIGDCETFTLVNTIPDSLDYVRDSGIVDESCLRYEANSIICDPTCSDVPPSFCYSGDVCSASICSERCSGWSDRLTRIGGYVAIDPSIEAIKTHLYEKGPIVSGISMVYQGSEHDVYLEWDIYKCINESWYNTPNYAVVIVGYNDTGNDTTSYWIMKSSAPNYGFSYPNEIGYSKIGFGECLVENDTYGIVLNHPANITILSFNDFYINETLRIFEINILNNGETDLLGNGGQDLSNAIWKIDFGDGNKSRSQYSFNLTTNESIFVYIEHNYDSVDGYNVTFNVTAATNNVSASASLTIKSPPVISPALPDVSFIEDEFNDSIDLDDYVDDANDDDDDSALVWTAVGNSSDTIRVKILDNHVVNITSAPNYYNETGINITFIVTDTDGLTDNDTIAVTVTEDNDPPNITGYTPQDLTLTIAVNAQLLFNHTSTDIDSPVLNYNWSLDGATQSTSQSWLYQPTGGEEGMHNVSLTVSDGFLSDSQNWTVTVSNIDVYNLSNLYGDKTLRIFEFYIKNIANYTLTNVNWSLNTGLETIEANELINLTANETVIVLVEYNYTQTGEYTVTASATDGSSEDEETIYIDLDLDATNLNVLDSSGNKRIFEFWITNYLNVNLTNVSWQFDTEDNLLINSTQEMVLEPDETAFVYLEYSFTSSGTYNVNATAINGSMKDSIDYTITID
ncbi:MAG: hypothetical protein KAK00_05920, partial [Nanoarchaeota archaeon]|nr:hypothetical protein [Nanoarchaeota archaeon]